MTGATEKMTGAMAELIGADLMDVLTGAFEQMEWAEDEIERAQRRHPRAADRIWHCFKLIRPSSERMGVEFVYRSHCREILDRVAAGGDTRPGTAAEICIAACEASALAPLTTTAAGLYFRMWPAAFPEHRGIFDAIGGQGEHYEAIRGAQIDDLEREARRKTGGAERRLGEVSCKGMHNGRAVSCSFATAAEPAQLAFAGV